MKKREHESHEKIHEEIRQNRMRDHDEGITLRHLAQKCNREKTINLFRRFSIASEFGSRSVQY